MSFALMILVVAAFMAAVIYLAKITVMQFEQQMEGDVLRVKDSYFQIITQKDAQAREKARLQEEADRIFNLYQLMRELTQMADVREAFESFRGHLSSVVRITDCQLVDTFHKRGGEISASFKDYKFFPLKAKKMVLGELAYKGLSPADEEVFAILAHQFALALRRIRLYKELEGMAITDSLTRLHTRRYVTERFEEEFERALLKGTSMSFLMIDIDFFKKVNDQYGHLAGDQVLKEVAHVISQHTREIDITGRYGGEEFCIVLPETDKSGAMVVAERIREAVNAATIKLMEEELRVSVSIGVANFPEDARKIDELMDKADWALYRAKKTGRNRVVGFSVYDDEGIIKTN